MKEIEVSRNEPFKIIIKDNNIHAIVKLEESIFEVSRGYEPPEHQSGTITFRVINFKFGIKEHD